jgi:hypothetical protein
VSGSLFALAWWAGTKWAWAVYELAGPGAPRLVWRTSRDQGHPLNGHLTRHRRLRDHVVRKSPMQLQPHAVAVLDAPPPEDDGSGGHAA